MEVGVTHFAYGRAYVKQCYFSEQDPNQTLSIIVTSNTMPYTE